MPSIPRPQTRRCRYADERGQCRSIATHGGEVCGRHARALEDAMTAEPAPSLVGDLMAGLFGGPAAQARLARAGDEIAARLGELGAAALGRVTCLDAPPPVPGQPAPPPRARRPCCLASTFPPHHHALDCPARVGAARAAAPPRSPPSPEAVARRRKVIEACTALGLDADAKHTEDDVRRAHMRRAKLCHVDGQAPDPERQKMLLQINAAKEFLVGILREQAARKPPRQG